MAIVVDSLKDGNYQMAANYRQLLCLDARKHYLERGNDPGVTIFPGETESKAALALTDFRSLGNSEGQEVMLIGCGLYRSYFAERPYKAEFVYFLETDVPFKNGQEMDVKAMRFKGGTEGHGAY
jgi:hypothetical protein